MAKPSTEREPKRDTNTKPAKGSLNADDGPLGDVKKALSRGDVRAARGSLKHVPATASEDEKSAAQELSARLGLDPAALGIGLVVLVMIALAATFALFMRHG